MGIQLVIYKMPTTLKYWHFRSPKTKQLMWCTRDSGRWGALSLLMLEVHGNLGVDCISHLANGSTSGEPTLHKFASILSRSYGSKSSQDGMDYAFAEKWVVQYQKSIMRITYHYRPSHGTNAWSWFDFGLDIEYTIIKKQNKTVNTNGKNGHTIEWITKNCQKVLECQIGFIVFREEK